MTSTQFHFQPEIVPYHVITQTYLSDLNLNFLIKKIGLGIFAFPHFNEEQ